MIPITTTNSFLNKNVRMSRLIMGQYLKQSGSLPAALLITLRAFLRFLLGPAGLSLRLFQSLLFMGLMRLISLVCSLIVPITCGIFYYIDLEYLLTIRRSKCLPLLKLIVFGRWRKQNDYTTLPERCSDGLSFIIKLFRILWNSTHRFLVLEYAVMFLKALSILSIQQLHESLQWLSHGIHTRRILNLKSLPTKLQHGSIRLICLKANFFEIYTQVMTDLYAWLSKSALVPSSGYVPINFSGFTKDLMMVLKLNLYINLLL